MHFLKKNLVDITIFILLQYFVITFLLMYLYTGGNVLNTAASSYDFSLNYLSDLGRTQSFSKHENPFWIFYLMSMFLIGIGTFLYFYLVSRLIKHISIRYSILILGAVSGLGYIFIGFIPVDVSLKGHILSGSVAVYAFTIASLIINSFIDKKTFSFIFYAISFLNIILLSRFVLLFYLADSNINAVDLLKIKVLTQKFVIYTQIIIPATILYYIKRKKIFYYEK